MRGKLQVVVGGQYGSEGKGAIVAHIANDFDVHVRVGSFNAGHTFYWNGEKHVQQAIPCGWINPNAKIIIGRGAIVPVDGLLEEIRHIEQYYPDFKRRLYIDGEAGVLESKYHDAEGGKDGWFNQKIGSTGEGCGAARVARMRRNGEFLQWKTIAKDCGLEECIMSNTPAIIAAMQNAGLNILIEGTQGSGLSLLHSHYPYCTSIDTNAAGIISEVGIAPTRVTDVLMICRTYPIRVAGNSGYMANEISWDELNKRTNKFIEPEKTTVTHKVRRIAEWDRDLYSTSIILNAPTSIAITFADYIDPALYGAVNVSDIKGSELFTQFINNNSIDWQLLKYVGTSPRSVVDMEV